MIESRTPYVIVAASSLVLAAGCTTSPTDSSASVGQTTLDESVAMTTSGPEPSLPVREFPPGESWDQAVQPLIVRVSNQSFDDPDVELTASLNGVALFHQSFAVEGQHTVTLFGVDVPAGEHTLTVVSDSGAEVEQAFTLPAGEQRWLVVNYGYADPRPQDNPSVGQETGPGISVSVSDEMVGIA